MTNAESIRPRSVEEIALRSLEILGESTCSRCGVDRVEEPLAAYHYACPACFALVCSACEDLHGPYCPPCDAAREVIR